MSEKGRRNDKRTLTISSPPPPVVGAIIELEGIDLIPIVNKSMSLFSGPFIVLYPPWAV